MPSLSCSNITKAYRGRNVLRDVSLSVDGGQTLCVLGTNGAGKSTLLKILSGLVAPDVGTAELKGEWGQVTGTDIARRVSYTSPYVGLYTQLTLAENLALVLGLKNISIDESRVSELAGQFQLERSLHSKLSEYSTGMVQRAKLAAAIAARGDALILDEPFANLDADGTDCVWTLIDEFRTAKKPVVVATNLRDVSSRFDLVHDLF